MPPMRDWAPAIWKALHIIASSYPQNPSDEMRDKFVVFINELTYFLPCGMCGEHMRKYMIEHPLHPWTGSKEHVEQWFYDLHEDVNNRKGVPMENRPSLEKVRELFRNGTWDEWKGYVPSLIYNKGKNPAIEEQLVLQDTSVSSSVAATNNNGLIIGVVIAVVAVVALGGIGYFVYAAKKSKSKKQTNIVKTISVK